MIDFIAKLVSILGADNTTRLIGMFAVVALIVVAVGVVAYAAAKTD
mgnify:CR=1 FL=1